jgi:thiamine biosynthesis protein ThiS
MKIKYQGKDTETGAANVAAFLEENGIVANEAVIELDGEIVAADVSVRTQLREGAVLNVFRIVAGG